MAALSPEKIAQYAHDAGFRGKDLTIAVAVALAESGGRTTAHNPVPPDDSYGLWQINMHGSLGPARRDEFDLDRNRDLFDPATNAEAAWEISGRGRTFEPWTTYTSGAYEKHLDEARRAARAVSGRQEDGPERDGGDGNGSRDGRDGDRAGGRGDRGGDRDGGARGGGAGDGGNRGGAGRGSGSGGARGGGNGGFMVDPDALTGYARTARRMSDELGQLSTHQLKGVRNLADDSFGKIGKETGFSDALDHFGAALQRQVRNVGTNADTLAGSVSRTARHYRDQEDDIAQDLLNLLRDR